MSDLKTSTARTQPLVIVLLGPTASGKTSLSIELAEQLNLSVLNVDSRQLYRGMDIGTAKPTNEQQRRVKHFLIDLREPDQPMTMQEFQSTANLQIQDLLSKEGSCLLVGGSGLYLKALTQGLCPPSVGPQKQIREQLNSLGQNICHNLLKTADPLAAKRIHPADVFRTQRALEVVYVTGKALSHQQKTSPPPWRVLELGLDPKDLPKRISKRTIQLYQNGLLRETERLSRQFSPELPLLQTIGYGEALKVLNGQLELEDAIALTTKRTLQFAKRQRTWFKKQHHPYWLKSEEPLNEAISVIKAA